MSRSPTIRRAEIAVPCHESWDAMTPVNRGRHCASCDKTVVDFAAMTPQQIVDAVRIGRGSICARVSRDAHGEIVTRAEPSGRGWLPHAAGFVLALALAGSAAAQAPAVVSGRAVMAKPIDEKQGPAAGAQVLLVQNGKQIASTKTDDAGRWNISVPAGQYDLIVRRNLMLGERVNDITLHGGDQEFAVNAVRFNFGHLGLERDTGTTTMGTVAVTIGYPPKYWIKHPLGYLKHLSHRFG